MGLSNSAGFKFIVRPPFHFHGVTSKSNPWRLPASPAGFSRAVVFPPAPFVRRRVKFDCDALVPCRIKFHGEVLVDKSIRRLDDGEDCGLEWNRKFSPSGDCWGGVVPKGAGFFGVFLWAHIFSPFKNFGFDRVRTPATPAIILLV